MSLDQSIYLGPFFECRNRRGEERERLFGCVNPRCPEHHRHRGMAEGVRFCGCCGRNLGEYEGGLMWRIGWGEVSEAVNGQLTLAGRDDRDDDNAVMRWVPNVARDGAPAGTRLAVARGETVVCEPGDRAAEERWLETAFGTELGILAGLYGDGFVTVGWGLIIWWQ